MKHPFEALASEYQAWVEACKPRPEKAREIEATAVRLLQAQNMKNFDEVRAKIDVPQVVQATICYRENNCDFSRSPAQGDPWSRISVRVPKGRGPFKSWIDAAIDAWTICDDLAELPIGVKNWSMALACWKWEGYNGFGYRSRGLRSPYVVGGTNLQQPGKYIADGVWDAHHMDGQLGCLPIAQAMIRLNPKLSIGKAAVVAAVEVIPPVQPVPVGVGGAGPDGVWQTEEIQAALNALGFGPLKVDGSYGRLTRAAVREFQKSKKLSVDGIAGTKETLPALEAAMKQKGEMK